VLRRANYRELRTDSVALLSAARTQDQALEATCALLTRALGAESSSWRVAVTPPVAGHPTILLDAHRTEACIVIPETIEPHHEIVIAGLYGGRTFLSDDLMLIDAVAAALGRRLDEIRFEAERARREQREREMIRLATEAELRALRAQLDPHFLFNTLNTLGHLMQAAPDRALSTLYRLTSLLRAVLRRTNGSFVALAEELEIVESYLAIERERFEERLAVTIDVPPELRNTPVPPLLLQPLVENAVKHGIAPLRQGGRVTVRIARDADDDGHPGHLRVLVIDTGRGVQPGGAVRDGGVGLSNLEARLRYYYGPEAALAVRPTPGGGTTVELCIPSFPSSARLSAETDHSLT
jgi:two-component system LytT family sensor kinase